MGIEPHGCRECKKSQNILGVSKNYEIWGGRRSHHSKHACKKSCKNSISRSKKKLMLAGEKVYLFLPEWKRPIKLFRGGAIIEGCHAIPPRTAQARNVGSLPGVHQGMAPERWRPPAPRRPTHRRPADHRTPAKLRRPPKCDANRTERELNGVAGHVGDRSWGFQPALGRPRPLAGRPPTNRPLKLRPSGQRDGHASQP